MGERVNIVVYLPCFTKKTSFPDLRIKEILFTFQISRQRSVGGTSSLSKLYLLLLINVGQHNICLFISPRPRQFCLFHSGDLWIRIWRLLLQISDTQKDIFFVFLKKCDGDLQMREKQGAF